MPIDVFFRALAVNAEERAIGVVLSGTGTDGTHGLRAIKAAGGLAIVQDPATAQHDGMLRSAIAADVADHVLPPEQIPARLREYVRHPYARGAVGLGPVPGLEWDALGDVLAVLRSRTRFDFRSYKRTTVERRIGRRMSLKHVDRIEDYVRVLTDEPAEAARLFDDLLITVTSFFRDPEAWRQLREDAIRPSVLRKDSADALRVWVPACATGEEAYSIAMLVIDALPAAGQAGRVEIFASDVDAGALEFARVGL
jgi:two-component system CheB/CheR fusion protein